MFRDQNGTSVSVNPSAAASFVCLCTGVESGPHLHHLPALPHIQPAGENRIKFDLQQETSLFGQTAFFWTNCLKHQNKSLEADVPTQFKLAVVQLLIQPSNLDAAVLFNIGHISISFNSLGKFCTCQTNFWTPMIFWKCFSLVFDSGGDSIFLVLLDLTVAFDSWSQYSAFLFRALLELQNWKLTWKMLRLPKHISTAECLRAQSTGQVYLCCTCSS